MKRFFNLKTTTGVVIFSCVFLTMSCINQDYQLSEEKINTDVTIFQEGLTLPLGTVAPIKFADIYNMLDPEVQEIIQNQGGKYGFTYADHFDLTDTLASVKKMLEIDSLAIGRSFSFNLSNVNLDNFKFSAMPVTVPPIEVSEVLNVPTINLPTIGTKETIKNSLPSLGADALNLSFDKISRDVELVSFEGLEIEEDDLKYVSEWVDIPMTYAEVRAKIADANEVIYEANKRLPESMKIDPLPTLPEIDLESSFSPQIPGVSVNMSLPSAIKSVKDIDFSSNASVKLSVKVSNSLFVDGDVELEMDLHEIFNMKDAVNGKTVNTFDLGKESLQVVESEILGVNLSASDWKNKEGLLTLIKDFNVALSGRLVNPKTTLNHLRNYNGGVMKLDFILEFCNLSVENVKMEIAPIKIEKTLEMNIDIPGITLPEQVKKVDYVDLANSLNLNLNAQLPDAFDGLNIDLKSLSISFPKELVVEHDNYKDGVLSYSDKSIVDGFSDKVNINRLNLPEPVGGLMTYSGSVKVVASAEASGVVNSRDLLDKNKTGDVLVNIEVDYRPVLEDYSVVINDYAYQVNLQPITFEEELPDAVGQMDKVIVRLENNPQIEINLEYPSADGAINIVPDKENGLKIYFPKMIVFGALAPEYNYNAEENSISFTKGVRIPNKIILPIKELAVVPQKKDNKYYVAGEMKVEGGVCLESTTITKKIVDDLVNEKAKIEFNAEIPELKPATLALNQYVASISETMEFEIPAITGIPEMIEIKSVDAFELDNVYLNMSVDASSIASFVDEVQMSMNFDVKLPKLIMVENATKDNVIEIRAQLNKDNKIVMDPVHVLGLDLSGLDFSGGSIEIGKQAISIDGNVTLDNVSIDIEKLKDADLSVYIDGSLATVDPATGLPTESIKIGKVQTQIGCEFEFDQSLDLTSITNGLEDQLDFQMDLKRYHLDLDLKTNLSLPVQLSELIVTPFKGGVAGEPRTLENPIVLNSNLTGDVTHSKIRVSNLESDKHEDPDYQHVVLDVLSLIKDMPDSVQLHIKAGTSDNATFIIEPSKDYVLEADYSFELPLELGEDFKIEFEEVVGDIPAVLSEVLAYGSLGLSGEVTNSFPLALDLEFQLLDVDGNIIPLAEGAGHQTIKAGNLDGSPAVTELKVVFGVEKGTKIPQINAVKLTFRATSSGAGFAEDNFIQVKLNADIPEGVSVNIKDLMNSTEQEK